MNNSSNLDGGMFLFIAEVATGELDSKRYRPSFLCPKPIVFFVAMS